MITVDIGDGHITVPTESLVGAWLDRVMGKKPAPAPFMAVPRIGAEWPGQGGIYAGIMRGEDGQPDYHLIVPTDPAAYNAEIAWGSPGQDMKDACSEFDGFANTVALMQSEHSHPAAEWAADIEIGELCDFYLPSRRELRLLWTNVPELFAEGWYWSSTQYAPNPDYAWFQHFHDGGQYYGHKSAEGRARAVRRLIIQ
jgi:hypothetical protein